jgi:hypothetical protein
MGLLNVTSTWIAPVGHETGRVRLTGSSDGLRGWVMMGQVSPLPCFPGVLVSSVGRLERACLSFCLSPP